MRTSYYLPLAITLLAIPFLAFERWEKPSQPPNFSELTSVVQHPTDSGKILAASARGILERNQRGIWKSLRFPQGTQTIRKIIRPDAYPHKLIALTQSGAYEFMAERGNWKTLFEKHTRDDYAVLSFAILPGDPDHLFVGTRSGLFESFDGGKIWYPFSAFGRDPIYLLRCSDAHLYVGTDQKLFRSQNLRDFREIFFIQVQTGELLSSDTEDALSAESAEENPLRPALNDLILDTSDFEEKLWIGTTQGVFESRDSGKSWQRLSGHGLLNPNIRHLVYIASVKRLFAGTSRGVFQFEEEKKAWHHLSAGMENQNIWALTFIQGNPIKIVAITPAGFSEWPVPLPDQLHIAQPAEINASAKEIFRVLVSREPSLRQINQRVIRDSKTGNWKTKRWHIESRLKTLLPDVSFSKDLSRGTSIDLDRGGTSDADRYILGPEDVSRGWDLGVSWDLGEFIWSSAQTSIDSREKMMIEFRKDLLAETARTFYERRRLQMEILFSPAASELEHYEKLLRLDELTALLDNLTGGWYGRRLEELQSRYPELESMLAYHGSNADLQHGSNADHEK